MSDLNTEIKIGADASGVEAGVGKAKRSLKDLGDAAQKAGKDAGAGMASVGAGGDKAAKDIERATKNIQGQLQRAIASFDAGEKGSRKFYESLARQRGADVNTLKPLLDQLDVYKAKSEAAAQASVKASSSFSGLGAAAGLAARAVAAIGVGASVGEFVRLADASTNVASRLSLVTSSAAELASVQQRLFGIAQASRVSFVDLVGTYAQVARSTKDLGVSQTALLGVIQTISQAVTISGGSAASAQAALVQLSQGFASGALRGEELNSVMEQTPRLAQAIADGLGISIGKLREMGQAGELTAEKVLGALEKSAASVAAEFGKMAVTVESASTTAANSALKLVGALDKITGASSAAASVISRIAAGMDALTLNIERLGSSKGLSDFFFLAFNNERSLNGELEITQKELAELEARLAKAPSNVYTRAAVAEMREYVKELKEAQSRLAALSGQSGPADPRDQSGFTGRGASYANEAARQAKLREDANAFRLNQAGVPASYLKDMAELIRLNQAGVIVGKEYTDALKRQQDILLQKTGVTKGAAAAANQEQNTYETLVASIRTKIAANEAEISGAGRLAESDKLRIKLQEELDAGSKTLTAAHKARALALLDILAAQEKEEARIKSLVVAYKQEAEIAEELAQAYVAQSKSRDAGRAAVSGYVSGIDESNKSLQLELSLMGQSEQARNVALEQYRIELDLKKQLAAINENIGFDEAQREEERAKARAAAAIATANASSRAFLDEWKQSVDKYDDIFRQGFADMLNNGQDGWKSFTKSLVTTFKTTVADQIYKMFAQKFVVNIVGNLMGVVGGGATQAVAGAASGGSALGGIGNIGSAISAGTSAFGIGASYGFQSLFANGLSGTLAAGGQMIGAGSIASGLGTIAGALGPIALGIGALMAIAKATKGETRTGGQFGVSFDGTVTNNRRDQVYTYQGQQFDRDFSNGERNALIAGQAYRLEGDPVAQESAIRDAVAGTAKGIDAFLQALGSTARLAGFSAGLETSGKGRGGVFSGGRFADGTAFGESGKGDNYEGTLFEKFSSTSPDFKQALSDFTLDLKQSTIQALQSVSDIPKSVQAMLANVDAEGLTDEAANALLESINAQIVGVGNLRKAFEAMDMPQFADLAFDSAAAIAAMSGGFDALGQSIATYYENFYSEAERAANTTQNITNALAGLGLAMPAGVAQFRALVDAQDLNTEAGQKTYAALMAVSGAFASVTQAAQAAQSILRGSFGSLAKSLADMRSGVAEADARVADARMDIWSGYADAQQKVIDLEMQAADATRGFAQSLRGFVSDLTTGPNSGLGLDARYQMLGQQFSATATRAGAGDQGARDSLTGVAGAYLDAARANARTSVEYARDAARVSLQLNKLATAAEADPLVQKYDAKNLTLQQQIADAQIDVVKYLALMEATGTSTDLGIQTVDKTLAQLRDEYVGATQAQAAASLKLDVALAALDTLGLTEELVKAIAANQANGLSAALNISDAALASITGALGLTPENVAELGKQFAVEVALLVGQAATDLAAALDGALAFDPATFDALRTVIGYDTASPDFAALHTILGFDLESDKFRALGTILGMAPEASAQVDALIAGIGFASDAAGRADALAGGIGFTGAAVGQIDLIAGGLGVSAELVETIKRVAAGVSFSGAAQDQINTLASGVSLSSAASAQVNGLLNGLILSPAAAAQVGGLLDGLQLAAVDRVTIERMLGGIGFDPNTATALQDGLGLQQGLLPMLGTALGLSPDAQKAIGVLSSMGTIDQTVRNAYAMVGRSGIGSDVSQIDQQGYDFWTKSLATGAVSMTDFTQQFLQSAAGAPDEALRAYVAPYLQKLGVTQTGPQAGLVVPAAYNPVALGAAAPSANNDAVVAELRALRAELATHKAELTAIRNSSGLTANGMTGIVNKQVTLVTEAV